MYGIGIWRGLNVTLKRFISTYVNDLRWLGTKQTPETFAIRQGTQAQGLFTVEYPDEKIAVPERFRFVPFLVVNNYDDQHAPGQDWCTSCGICAKVCPPQCIWIVRGTRVDPKSGRERPKPEPDAFFIDIDICMNCGLCAEYCPFDAIKMDHDYELASYDRTTNHIYDKDRLSKEVRYWQTISPQNAFEEALSRGQWEHKDTAKLAKKAGIGMTEPDDWDNRVKARHNPEIASEKAAPVAAAPQAGVPAAAPQAVSISLDVDGATPDKLAEWSADAGLPLAARSAAAVKLDSMMRAKEFKPTSTHRKAVSAAKKDAKAQDTTIEDAASGFTSGEVVTSAAPAAPRASAPAQAAAPAPAAQPAAVSIDVDGADPNQLAQWAGDDGLPIAARSAAAVKLDGMIRAKEFKPASDHRKAISAAKKAAKEADTTIEDAASGFTSGEVVTSAAPAPVAEAVAEVAEVVEAVSETAAGGDDAIIAEAKELEAKGKAKEIKLTSADRKQIAAAKKLAKDKGIEW